MTRLSYFFAVVLAATNTMASASETRQADAHEHGHGQLTIAIEGTMIEMELEIPGADIVGFEHAPETAAQHDAIDDGKAKLSAGDALFQVVGEAGCTLQETRFMEEDDHDHDEKSSDAEPDGEHMEFHVNYRFSCTDAAKITGFSFPFFKQFPDSEEIDVQIVSPKGQFQFEVSPDQSALILD